MYIHVVIWLHSQGKQSGMSNISNINAHRDFKDAKFESDLKEFDEMRSQLHQKIKQLQQWRHLPHHMESALTELQQEMIALNAATQYVLTLYAIKEWD